MLGECFGFVGKSVGEFYLLGAWELNIEELREQLNLLFRHQNPFGEVADKLVIGQLHQVFKLRSLDGLGDNSSHFGYDTWLSHRSRYVIGCVFLFLLRHADINGYNSATNVTDYL